MVKKGNIYKSSVINVFMHKGLLRLNDNELHWLEGRIGTIDVQKGCPVQCIICGYNAPKYSGSMSWSDYMILSDSIFDVKEKKGIDILAKQVLSFSSSEPIYYYSKDGDIEKTIYHVLTDIISRHKKETYITTSGWNYGDNHMQRAAEKIAEVYDLKNSKLFVYYSIKTVSKRVMNEYDYFLKRSENTSVSDSEFIKESCYVSNLVHNAQTLAPLGSIKAFYDFQFFDDKDILLLNSKYAKYASLFSEKFMTKLYNYFNEKKITNSYFNKRRFTGIGRALNTGDISIDYNSQKITEQLHSNSSRVDRLYNVEIDGYGRLKLFYGENDSLSKMLVPKEYFAMRAKQSDNSEDKQTYQMLANLQGKELLR